MIRERIRRHCPEAFDAIEKDSCGWTKIGSSLADMVNKHYEQALSEEVIALKQQVFELKVQKQQEGLKEWTPEAILKAEAALEAERERVLQEQRAAIERIKASDPRLLFASEQIEFLKERMKGSDTATESGYPTSRRYREPDTYTQCIRSISNIAAAALGKEPEPPLTGYVKNEVQGTPLVSKKRKAPAQESLPDIEELRF